MFRVLLLQSLLLLQFTLPVMADEYKGLRLRGEGTVNFLGIFKVYDAFLYTDSLGESKDVLSRNCSRCLKLNYAMGLSAEDIIEASELILKRQHNAATLSAVQTELTQVYYSYKDVKEGDSYIMCYDEGTQVTSVTLNNTLLVEVTSPKFAAIYFGIWLGERNSIDDSLRRKLLSKQQGYQDAAGN